MPDLCRFRGIAIRMRLNDHAPPHFHVYYAEFTASIEISSLVLMKGRLPPGIRRMVENSAKLRENELQLAWQQIRSGQILDKIEGPN